MPVPPRPSPPPPPSASSSAGLVSDSHPPPPKPSQPRTSVAELLASLRKARTRRWTRRTRPRLSLPGPPPPGSPLSPPLTLAPQSQVSARALEARLERIATVTKSTTASVGRLSAHVEAHDAAAASAAASAAATSPPLPRDRPATVYDLDEASLGVIFECLARLPPYHDAERWRGARCRDDDGASGVDDNGDDDQRGPADPPGSLRGAAPPYLRDVLALGAAFPFARHTLRNHRPLWARIATYHWGIPALDGFLPPPGAPPHNAVAVAFAYGGVLGPGRGRGCPPASDPLARAVAAAATTTRRLLPSDVGHARLWLGGEAGGGGFLRAWPARPRSPAVVATPLYGVGICRPPSPSPGPPGPSPLTPFDPTQGHPPQQPRCGGRPRPRRRGHGGPRG